MNNQPWAASPSAEKGPTLYQGNQNEIRRTKLAGPTTQSLPFRAFSRWRDFRTRLGARCGTTVSLMAAPHLGQSAVPGGTSTRQREQAGKSATLLRETRTRWSRLQAEPASTRPCPRRPPLGSCRWDCRRRGQFRAESVVARPKFIRPRCTLWSSRGNSRRGTFAHVYQMP